MTVTTRSAAIPLSAALREHAERHGVGLAPLARRAGLAPALAEALADGEPSPLSLDQIEAIADALSLQPSGLEEYRLALVLRSLAHAPERRDELFLQTLSSIELRLLDPSVLGDEPLARAVERLLGEHELSRQELAEGIGVSRTVLGRVLRAREQPSVELLEAIARNLGCAPELFVEYRLGLIGEWLREHPAELDARYRALTREPTLAEHRAWQPRALPDPASVAPQALLESIVEIVAAEGPVLGARAYELRLAASELEETPALRALLNRAAEAACAAGLIVGDDETAGRRQKYRVFRLPGQPRIVLRKLGARKLSHVPARELRVVLRASTACQLGACRAQLEQAVLRSYGLSHASQHDRQQLRRRIAKALQGDVD